MPAAIPPPLRRGSVFTVRLNFENLRKSLEARVGIGQLKITFLPRSELLDLQANQASTLVPQ